MTGGNGITAVENRLKRIPRVVLVGIIVVLVCVLAGVVMRDRGPAPAAEPSTEEMLFERLSHADPLVVPDSYPQWAGTDSTVTGLRGRTRLEHQPRIQPAISEVLVGVQIACIGREMAAIEVNGDSTGSMRCDPPSTVDPHKNGTILTIWVAKKVSMQATASGVPRAVSPEVTVTAGQDDPVAARIAIHYRNTATPHQFVRH